MNIYVETYKEGLLYDINMISYEYNNLSPHLSHPLSLDFFLYVLLVCCFLSILLKVYYLFPFKFTLYFYSSTYEVPAGSTCIQFHHVHGMANLSIKTIRYSFSFSEITLDWKEILSYVPGPSAFVCSDNAKKFHLLHR